ncbi:uncharacterized protein ACR2FA_008394 [Aphomia sociella]
MDVSQLMLTESQYICDECITKLRDASVFKKQILDVEEILLKRFTNLDKDENIALKIDDSCGELDNVTEECGEQTNESTFFIDQGDINDDDGQIFVIKLEPKEESLACPKPTVKRPLNLCNKSEARVRPLRKLTKSKRTRPKKVPDISQTQIDVRENSLKLVQNSTLCLFKSRKTRFGCFFCGESFLTIAELKEHTKLHSNTKVLKLRFNSLRGLSYKNVEITDLSCKICSQSCTDLEDLKSHLITHNIEFRGDSHLLIPYKLEDSLKCTICEQNFNTFTRLSIHMNNHYMNNVCEICGISYINRVSLRTHVNSMHREKKCSHCPATFLTNYSKVKHMKKNHNTGHYKRYCLLCNKAFRYTYMLVEHKIQEHGAKRQICECTECGKTFHSPQNLKIHIRCVHVKERNYPCSVCFMRFFTKCDQRRHERTHENVRPFSCSYCDGRFKSKDSWRRHLRRQHGQLEQTQ